MSIYQHDASGNPTKIASTNVTGDTLVIGSIQIWPSDTIPYGWLLCNGQAVSRTIYNELFATIGTTHGSGDGSTTFNVPDMRDYTVIGKSDTDSNINVIGKKYGAKTHTLTIDEMPSHNHPNSVTNGQGNREWGYNFQYTNTAGEHSGASGYTGGGQAHNNLQPSIAENYIIKAKQTPGVVAKAIDNLNSTSATDALSANQGRLLNDRLSNLLNFFYPIGTIYETTSTDLDTTTKMAAHFGGIWEEYGSGKVTVAKSADTEFDTIGKTGGEKTHTLITTELPATTWHSNDQTGGIQTYIDSGFTYGMRAFGTDLGQAHNNLQPYIVVFRYRRTA